tara:strand:+ start:1659 stop:1796 length:138 start_codon:yes stop_codon:yes gene_type:complete
MKKYTIMLRGHQTVFAESEKKAMKIVEKDLSVIHPKFNLHTSAEL